MMNPNKLTTFRNIAEIIDSKYKSTNSRLFMELTTNDQVICMSREGFNRMQDKISELYDDISKLQKQNMELLSLLDDSDPELLKDLKCK